MKVNSILIFGPPASGKNTIGRMLQGKIEGAKYLQNHDVIDLVTSIFPFASEAAKKLALEIRRMLFMEWADSGLGTLITTQVLDMSAENDYTRLYQMFLQKVAESGRCTLIVALTADQGIREQRAQDPERRKFRNVSPQQVLQFIRQDLANTKECRYEDIFPLAHILHLDTSHLTPEDCVNEILAKKTEIENAE